jgi:mono/diheme cytochrome c family protein
MAELQALPRATLAGYQAIGSSRGPLGSFTWVGASLRDLLLRVDPKVGDASLANARILFTSSDGWTATMLWRELFGTRARGEALYAVKGCNECHGVQGEGSAPGGKRPAPALGGRAWDVDGELALLRTGRDSHGGMIPYTLDQLSRADLSAILEWFGNPSARARSDPYQPRPDRGAILLAYERDGRPMTGRDGLVQLVVGPDEFASRYSHWVTTIEVQPAAR